MTTPKFEHDEFERTLLASARDDGMPEDSKAALAAALGLGVGAVTTMATIGTKAATAGVAASKAKATLSLAILKWIAAGTLGGAAIVSVAATARHVRDGNAVELTRQEREPSVRAPESAGRNPPTLAATAASVVPEAPQNAEPVLAPASDEPTPAPASAPSTLAPASAPARAPAIAVAPTVADRAFTAAPPMPRRASPATIASASAPLLADEQRIIERARRAFVGGDLASAGRALDEHDLLYPGGELVEESSMIRIDVLERSGDHERAQRDARAFLLRSPSSPYAARLRALAAGTPKP